MIVDAQSLLTEKNIGVNYGSLPPAHIWIFDKQVTNPKNIENNLVVQQVFIILLGFIYRRVFAKHNLFGITRSLILGMYLIMVLLVLLSRYNSMCEIVDGM